MDSITQNLLNALSVQYPHKAVMLTHQFLDGHDGNECGFVPHDWNGETVLITGKWWQVIIMPIIEYKNGMTVSELKKLIENWAEIGPDGEPSEVWIGTLDGLSNQVTIASSLNSVDLLLR